MHLSVCYNFLFNYKVNEYAIVCIFVVGFSSSFLAKI